MAKIIKVQNGIVSVGMDNGTITEVRESDLQFTPQVGIEVDVYQSEASVIVSKKKEVQEESKGGININVSNGNNQGEAYIANGKKAVNKVVYCLLTFFLGGIGIHKFYAGKTGTGILFILFCWTGIPSIIAFIEFIIGLCKQADENGNILV